MPKAAKRPGLTQALGLHKKVRRIPMDITPAREMETFFAVSTRKLVVMSICTFGLYQVYWIYWNWRLIKFREHRRISPPWRSVLGLFFLYPIFRRINRQSKLLGHATLPAGILFIVWAALSLAGYLPLPALAMLSFASVFALVPAQRSANEINFAASSEHPRNDRFEGLNWVALVLGGPLFALTALGALIQGVQT